MKRLWSSHGVRAAAWAFTIAVGGIATATAWTMPSLFFLSLVLPAAALAICLSFAYPAGATALWLAILATCPEMWLGDLVGNGLLIIGVDKAIGLLLALVCVARYGPRRDIANPGLAFAAMSVAGGLHGYWPGLLFVDSLRSLVGSLAPSAFSFARLPLGWSRRVIGVAILSPYLILALGLVLACLGLRPLYVLEVAALRLGASTHPAFLAGFALISIYALLLEITRRACASYLVLLGGDLVILLATGARGPLLIAAILILVVALLVPAPNWSWRSRGGLVLGLAAVPPLAIFAAPALGFLRVLSLAGQGDVTDLSNRTLIWPAYEAAFRASPWVGWGIGTDKVLVRIGTPLFDRIGTNAAHDEYLRIAVEGGGFGLIMLIFSLALWLRFGTRRMVGGERAVMICVFLAFAAHSATDNTLIATTASLMFAWVSAVFARAEAEPAVCRRARAGRYSTDGILVDPPSRSA
jgi:O-antigen ligase